MYNKIAITKIIFHLLFVYLFYLQRSDGKWFHSKLHPSTVKLKETNVIQWNETYKVHRSIWLESGTTMPIAIHVPLFNKLLNYEMTAEAINIEYHDWVFSCKPDYHSKKYWYNKLHFYSLQFSMKSYLISSSFGVNWSSHSIISVSKFMKRRHITLKLSDVQKLGHSDLVFKIKNTKKPVKLSIA